MDSFKYSVLYVSIIILIIALVVIGLSIKNSVSNTEWPPVTGNCPDFWKFDDATRECVNINGLGSTDSSYCPNYPSADTTHCERFNFEDDVAYSGNVGKCQKQKWADALGLSWDGITNNREICDN
tara:strand:+ start:2242 stop:2616 length:375 start_codon:yes stop_codon:yes gene_type:complete